ncbi:TonB-dependent hemoglobin/transferrin/lactoferrin family receptor [Robbsia sp. KACC 23696]|uniref:TonB-dependent hemoglobin/transferrin/lactoferrin family receptor n=1 Tax=Robbsia sp. KACC 23696 TaxID=3149231 RepID=UPI00325BD1A5
MASRSKALHRKASCGNRQHGGIRVRRGASRSVPRQLAAGAPQTGPRRRIVTVIASLFTRQCAASTPVVLSVVVPGVLQLSVAVLMQLGLIHTAHAATNDSATLSADTTASSAASNATSEATSDNATAVRTSDVAHTERQLDAVQVNATRGASAEPSKSAATVSVITADDMDARNVRDVKDALRYEPGVTVRRASYRPTGITGTSGRAGNEGVNIRGLEGNQVLLLEDGIPLPQSFSFGSGATGRGDYLNTDFYQRIEVLRGPASSVYGSDGLTGAVNFVSKTPAELLSKFNKPSYFSLHPSYNSVDRSVGGSATAAFGGERVEGMLMLSGRRGHELDSRGDNNVLGAQRSSPDPLTYNTRSALGKLVFHLTPRDTFTLTAGSLDTRSSSNGLSQLNGGYTWSGYSATKYLTDNRVTSNRIALGYDHEDASNPWVQSVKGQVYYRHADTRQNLYIDGVNTAGATASRLRMNNYSDAIAGTTVQAQSHFDTGPIRHELLYGFDLSQSWYRTSSGAGTEWTATDGYPEYFPRTTYLSFGTFLQDTMRYGRVSLIPGLRFDYFKMTPHADATYLAASAGSTQATTTASGNALSPRVALLYEVTPAIVPYVQYARGFRAPSAFQVNSYYNPVGSYGLYYQQIGNPNLKPETSNSLEAGLRGKLDLNAGTVRYSAAAFYGRYQNFIDTKVVGGSVTSATNPYTVQYVNYARAVIRGVEGKASLDLKNGFTFKGGFAAIKGYRQTDGVSSGLDTVPPFSAVFGLNYDNGRQWFGGADMIYNARKSKSAMSSSAYFSTPSYFLVDLHAGYRFGRHATLTVGIENLLNRKYWAWNDVRGLADSDGYQKISGYTAPGRSVSVGLNLEF